MKDIYSLIPTNFIFFNLYSKLENSENDERWPVLSHPGYKEENFANPEIQIFQFCESGKSGDPEEVSPMNE